PAPLEPEPAADPAVEASGFSVPATSMPADAAGEMSAREVDADEVDADEVDFAAAPDEYSYANPLEMSAEATSEIPNDDLASEDSDAAAALDPNHGPAIDLE